MWEYRAFKNRLVNSVNGSPVGFSDVFFSLCLIVGFHAVQAMT